VTELAEQNGARTDIVVNTAEHIRAGGVVDRHGLTVAREEIDVRYLGLLRLAQAFGPILRVRGADGVNSAAAFVNLLSVHALMNWPAYGSYSATGRQRRHPCHRPDADAVAGIPDHCAATRVGAMRVVPNGGGVAVRRTRTGLVLEQHQSRRAYRNAFRRADPLDFRQGSTEQRG